MLILKTIENYQVLSQFISFLQDEHPAKSLQLTLILSVSRSKRKTCPGYDLSQMVKRAEHACMCSTRLTKAAFYKEIFS